MGWNDEGKRIKGVEGSTGIEVSKVASGASQMKKMDDLKGMIFLQKDWIGDQSIIVAVDTGSTCGIATMNVSSGRISSRTSKPDRIHEAWASCMFEIGATEWDSIIYTRESAYSISNQSLSKGRANAGALWKHGYNAGIADSRLSIVMNKLTATWYPVASSWRSVLGLNKGLKGVKRESVNDAVLMWAESSSGKSIRTKRGKKLYDEANAVAMSYATAEIIRRAKNECK